MVCMDYRDRASRSFHNPSTNHHHNIPMHPKLVHYNSHSGQEAQYIHLHYLHYPHTDIMNVFYGNLVQYGKLLRVQALSILINQVKNYSIANNQSGHQKSVLLPDCKPHAPLVSVHCFDQADLPEETELYYSRKSLSPSHPQPANLQP